MPSKLPTLSDSFDVLQSKVLHLSMWRIKGGGGGVDSGRIEVILLFWRKFGLYSLFPLKGMKNY